MQTVVIPAKMSGTGSIRDIASQHCDKYIRFRKNHKYAFVFADFYGRKTKFFETSERAAAFALKTDFAGQVIDCFGKIWIAEQVFEMCVLVSPSLYGRDCTTFEVIES